MRSRQIKAMVFTAGILLLFFSSFASALPMLPAVIQGTVSINNGPAPQNTRIDAEIDGEIIKSVITTSSQYIIAIKGDESTVGKPITLYVDGIRADATTTWESGKVETIDLAVEKKDDRLYLYAIVAALACLAAFLALRKKKRAKK